jgi:queuosine precursor transporter
VPVDSGRNARYSTALDRKQKFYIWLTAIFVAALITSDLIGAKFFRVAGFDLSVGMIPFPLTFLLTDIVNEFYGTEGARRLTFVGLGVAVFVFAIINLSIALPTSPESPMAGDLFKSVYGWSSRLYIASLTAYLIGQLLDISVFLFLRKLTGHRFLWLRATGSTALSQLVDTMVVNFVLLAGTKSMHFILITVRNSYVIKLAIAVALTPLIYAGHALLRRHFHVPETITREAPATATAQH